jgi:glycosyltransferase involved in cell wall biosynthesis
MNVGMVLRGQYPPDIRVRKEAAALCAAGHEVRLLCLAGDGDEPDEVEGVEVERLDWGGLSLPRRAVNRASYLFASFDTVWYRRLRAFVAAHDVDVLHVHDLPLVRTALWVARRGDTRVVADLHENYPAAVEQYRAEKPRLERLRDDLVRPRSRIRRANREALHEADATLTVVEEARDHYLAAYDAPAERVHVVSNTVDLSMWDAADATPAAVPEGFVVSYVGSFGPHRGLETLIRATARSPAVELVLVGSGSDRYEQRLRALVAAEGIRDRVTFTGWVDFDEVPGYVAASDVATVPHRATDHTATTVPHKLFQYMARETPVLVTDVGPLGRIVRETDAGVVVPPDGGAAAADALAALADDPDECDRLGANGRAAVESEYNWARDATRLRAVYDHLA